MSKFDCVSIVHTPSVTLLHLYDTTLFVSAELVTAFTQPHIVKIVKDNPAWFGEDAAFFTDANTSTNANANRKFVADLRRVRKVLGTTLLVLCIVDTERTAFAPLFTSGENYYDILYACMQCIRESMPDYADIAERCQRGLRKIKTYLGDCHGPQEYQKLETYTARDIAKVVMMLCIITRITR